MQEKHKIIHSIPADGKRIDICPEVSLAAAPVKEETNATVKPVIKRHGNVMSPETRSFLPGKMFLNLTCFAFKSRYQTRISEGMQCKKIFISSEAAENITVSCAAKKSELAVPEKKRTMYRISNSKYIPIFLSLRFSGFYYYIIVNNYRLISKK